MTRREHFTQAREALRIVQAVEDQMLCRGAQRDRPVSVLHLRRVIDQARLLYALVCDAQHEAA